MSPEESPQDKYERIQRRLQEEILNKYPNPERKGCPGRQVLARLAGESFNTKLEGESDWEHVTHCSECYREYLEIRAGAVRAKERRANAIRWSVAGTVLLAAVLLFVFVRVQTSIERPQNAELAYQPRTIDIQSMSRSVGPSETKSAIDLGRGLIALTVQLPIGSKTGVYEFRLRNGSGSVVLMRSAAAQLRDGIMAFVLKLDLHKAAPGQYRMEIRQSPFNWNYYPVEIR